MSRVPCRNLPLLLAVVCLAACARKPTPPEHFGPPPNKRALEQLAEKLRDYNHGDTFSPWGAVYSNSEEAFAELAGLGDAGIEKIASFLEEPGLALEEPRCAVLALAWAAPHPRILGTLSRLARENPPGTRRGIWARYSLCRLNADYERNFRDLSRVLGSVAARREEARSAYPAPLKRSGSATKAAIALGRLEDPRTLDLFSGAAGIDENLDWVLAVESRGIHDPAVVDLAWKIIEARLTNMRVLQEATDHFGKERYPFECVTEARESLFIFLWSEFNVIRKAMETMRRRGALSRWEFMDIIEASGIETMIPQECGEGVFRILEAYQEFIKTSLPETHERRHPVREPAHTEADVSRCAKNMKALLLEHDLWTLADECFDAAHENDGRLLAKGLDLGFDPRERDRQGRTVLHIAAFEGFAEIVRLLLESRADPDIRDARGCTPLHDAAEAGKRKAVDLLLTCHADKTMTNREGKTALDLAREHGHTKITALLK
ncbi:MAG: ankyrin repeat domain-containing protein [Planctomycetota bacterium]|jgi:hypothetical protein